MMRTFFSFLAALLLLAAAHPATAQTFYRTDAEASDVLGYGRSMAVADDVVFIGEPLNTLTAGAVYAYEQDDAGAWVQTATLTGPDAFSNDYFGHALLADGQTLYVSSTRAHEGHGAVYVYERGGDGGWMHTATITPEGGQPGDDFGQSLALAGDWLVVGATGHQENTGAVYVFHRMADGSWMQEARLAAEEGAESDRLGVSVEAADGWVFASATGADNFTGAVYAFHRHDDGSWMQAARLVGSEVAERNAFGNALMLHAGDLFVGTPFQGGGDGVVYVFGFDAEAEAWAERGQLAPFDGASRTRFGTSLARSGNDLWIGAPGGEGQAYLLRRDAGGAWTSATKVNGDDLSRRDAFASRIAASEDVAVFGVTGADYGAGAARIFTQQDGMWTMAASFAGPSAEVAPITGDIVECSDGKAAGFGCKDVDLVSFMPLHAIGAGRGVRANDLWGWTDPETGKEYAIVGLTDGTSFIDVSDAYNPVYLGFLPKTDGAPGSTWRDMKVYRDHAFIVSDGAGQHGMQVFDLTKLRGVTEPQTFEMDALYENIASAHNIVINEDTGYAFAVGSSQGGETCGGGLHMIDIREPDQPTFAGCFGHEGTGRRGTGYTHDAQCVVYNGPDADYQGQEICFGANETALSIADVTDKSNPVAISSADYPNVGYTHQGWLTEDQRYFFINDELDELQGEIDGTRTLIWDVSDLDDPQLVREYISNINTSDHNLYVRGNLMYQSNYVSGLRVFDVSDPTNPVEVGYFDTVPYGDDAPGFNGSWSNYPYFESGVVVVTSGREGVFVLKKKEADL